ncbi:MAG: hypothetical protein K2Z80_16875 [Xanthobacteraceae bacterium]|nr:hypothetical protein [Xanthobacteraceae bacterium]
MAISASVALNRIGGPAIPALTRAVSSGSDRVVVHAANALWWMGPGGNPALPALLEVVGSEKHSDASRVAAARTALKIDAAACRESPVMLSGIPMLIRVLEHGSFLHQGWAAETLGGIGPAARDALPMLRKRLKLPSEDVDTGRLVRDYVRREAEAAISAIESGSAGNRSDSP